MRFSRANRSHPVLVRGRTHRLRCRRTRYPPHPRRLGPRMQLFDSGTGKLPVTTRSMRRCRSPWPAQRASWGGVTRCCAAVGARVASWARSRTCVQVGAAGDGGQCQNALGVARSHLDRDRGTKRCTGHCEGLLDQLSVPWPRPDRRSLQSAGHRRATGYHPSRAGSAAAQCVRLPAPPPRCPSCPGQCCQCHE